MNRVDQIVFYTHQDDIEIVPPHFFIDRNSGTNLDPEDILLTSMIDSSELMSRVVLTIPEDINLFEEELVIRPLRESILKTIDCTTDKSENGVDCPANCDTHEP